MDPHGLGAYWLSLAFTFVGAAVFAFARTRRGHIPQEAFIGIAYAVASAAAILAMVGSRALWLERPQPRTRRNEFCRRNGRSGRAMLSPMYFGSIGRISLPTCSIDTMNIPLEALPDGS